MLTYLLCGLNQFLIYLIFKERFKIETNDEIKNNNNKKSKQIFILNLVEVYAVKQAWLIQIEISWQQLIF